MDKKIDKAIDIGQFLAKIENHFIMNYAKNVYEDRINELEGCKAELEKHLATLEGYRHEVRDFFSGPEAEEFETKCDYQIKLIRNKYEMVEEMIKSCRTAIEVQDEGEKKIDQQIDNLDKVQKAAKLFD